jgi:hypothetical protein
VNREGDETNSEVEKALSGLSAESRAKTLAGLKDYLQFTGLNPKQLIEEAEADRRKSSAGGLPEERIYAFYKHLLTEKKVEKKLANSYFNAVRIFYKKNGCSLKVTLTRALKYAEYVLGIH